MERGRGGEAEGRTAHDGVPRGVRKEPRRLARKAEKKSMGVQRRQEQGQGKDGWRTASAGNGARGDDPEVLQQAGVLQKPGEKKGCVWGRMG